jgi:D-glycero-D-manno-heptose 1,7-bisphosphate phosphatase
MSPAARKALFLDRDGVINVDRGYVHTPEQTEWIPGIFELCRRAAELGYLLVVITNQAGIARGYYGEAEFAQYSDWLRGQFAERGLRIEAIYHCPHHPTEGIGELRRECDCRKPQPGMILRAARELGLDLSGSALLGDQPWDMEAARRAGVAHRFRLGAPVANADNGGNIDEAIAWLDRLARER